MEHETDAVITAKVAFAEKPKWTTMMANNVRQRISWAMDILAHAPK
jgi:hypothetical protein